MKRLAVWGAIALLTAGCASAPPQANPAPKLGLLPSAPKVPTDTAGDFTQQQVDLTIINGPQTMTAGKTEMLTARVMVPPGTQVLGLATTAGKDAFTFGLKLTVSVPKDAGAPRPLEVQIPFTPNLGGTYFLDGARRFAIQVGGDTGYGSPSYGSSGSYGSVGSYGSRTGSFLDRGTYTGGAYVPGGSGGTTTPSSVDTPPAPMWGDPVALSTVTPGAVLGNDKVAERQVLAIQGPSYGTRGSRLTWTATLWTAGTGPIAPDVVQSGPGELRVAALIAPADQEPIGVPMPRQTTMNFSWVFQDPGMYRIVGEDGITLGMVTIN